MSKFPNKQFQGKLYVFDHLAPAQMQVSLNSQRTNFVDLHVTYGCHCFTEEFRNGFHTEHHRYTYSGELRAFDPSRYACSLQLPLVVEAMLGGRVYHADKSYTYVAQITLPSADGTQSYSVFFSLEKDRQVERPALKMYIKSAYLKPLVAQANAQSWRFVSLAGDISGAFTPKEKKSKPKKKKTP